jgi:hypothetical protein
MKIVFKRITSCCALFTLLVLLSSWSFNKSWSVSFEGHAITIIAPAPSIGMVGFNEIYFNGVDNDDIGKDIYSSFTSIRGHFRSGNYVVYLKIKRENSYGETVFVNKGKLCTLNAEKVRRYADYSYFKSDYPIDFFMKKKCYPQMFNNKY